MRILVQLFAVGVMDEPLSTWDWQKLKRDLVVQSHLQSYFPAPDLFVSCMILYVYVYIIYVLCIMHYVLCIVYM